MFKKFSLAIQPINVANCQMNFMSHLLQVNFLPCWASDSLSRRCPKFNRSCDSCLLRHMQLNQTQVHMHIGTHTHTHTHAPTHRHTDTDRHMNSHTHAKDGNTFLRKYTQILIKMAAFLPPKTEPRKLKTITNLIPFFSHFFRSNYKTVCQPILS